METTYDVQHPILLPRKHHVMENFVRYFHLKLGHLGKNTMISEIRLKYWIVGVSGLVRRILGKCVSCRRMHARSVEQLMGDLPRERLSPDLPVFSNIGIDCFGPFSVKRGRSEVKRYGVIFTCLTSRAMHLEVAFSLSTESFISAFRRFISRRGQPLVVYSDNGTNFIGAERELKDSIKDWNEKQVQDWLLQRDIRWKFNPPTASNFGGIWEREIRSVRKVMNGLTHAQNLNLDDEEFNTLLCEVEAILNSRPLTPASDSPDDMEAITPNHLLTARAQPTFPPGLFTKDELYARRRWRQIQYLSDLFWTRWKREYIPLLQQRSKWHKERDVPQPGDLVLLTDQSLPRNQWSLGRVIDLIKDRKGIARIADVRVAKIRGEIRTGAKSAVVRRPISKLILLLASETLKNG